MAFFSRNILVVIGFAIIAISSFISLVDAAAAVSLFVHAKYVCMYLLTEM